MPKLIHSAARQLEQLLTNKLIPFAQNGAPVILFDAPPHSRESLGIREKKTKKLPAPRRKKSYPGYMYWPHEHVNSIDVPVLGCVFEGEADYDVRNTPGKPGRSWLIPVRAGTFFAVNSGIPFTAGKLPWERPAPKSAYARCMVMQLRQDGIVVRPYAMDKGALWKHPALFLHEPQAYLLGERLLQELRRSKSTFDIINYHYILLILYLMQRCLMEGRYAKGYPAMTILAQGKEKLEEMPVEMEAAFPDPVSLAKEAIAEHLVDADLSSSKIAQHTGLSSRHLNRLFKEQESVSLFDYLQQQKLIKARLLLKNPAISIEQVAIYCGFRQRSHFSAWFSKHTRTSPRTYRTQLRKKL